MNSNNPFTIQTITPEFRLPTSLIFGPHAYQGNTPMPSFISALYWDNLPAAKPNEGEIQFFANLYNKLHPVTGLTQSKVSGFSKRLFFKLSNKLASEANYSILLESYSNNFVLELMHPRQGNPRYAEQITDNGEEKIEPNASFKEYRYKLLNGQEKTFVLNQINGGSQQSSGTSEKNRASITILRDTEVIFKAELVKRGHTYATRHPKHCHINNPYLPK